VTTKPGAGAQNVEEQGRAGIEPARTLAVAAGLLACASKHNGLLHVSVASRSLRSLGGHTAARPAGACNPRYVLRPFAPAVRPVETRRTPIPKHVLAMASPSPQVSKPGAARGLEGWPRPTTHRPRGAPQPHATTERTYLHWPDSVAPCSPRQGYRFAALRAPLTRLRAPLGGVGQRRSP